MPVFPGNRAVPKSVARFCPWHMTDLISGTGFTFADDLAAIGTGLRTFRGTFGTKLFLGLDLLAAERAVVGN